MLNLIQLKQIRISLASILILAALPSFAIETAFESDDSLPMVYINVAVKTGFVTDQKDHSGLTSFMGKMLLRGSKKRRKEDIDIALDNMGAKLSVSVRAEALVLNGAVLSTELDNFLSLLEEIILEPAFPLVEIEKLKNEVEAEILANLGNDSTIAQEKFNHFLFSGHPYGNTENGNIKSVRQFNLEKIQAKYDELFQGKKLLIAGTGNASHTRIEKFAKQLAQARPAGKEVELIAEPAPHKRALVIVDKPDRTQSWIYGGQIGLQMTHPDYFPLYVANHAFGGGSFNSRMMKEIRVERGWSYGAYSYFRHGTRPRSWQFSLFPAINYTPEALAYSLKMVRDFHQSGISKEEYEFAKTSLINNAGFSFNTPEKRVDNIILEKTLNLPQGFMSSFKKRIETVSLEQANAAVKKYFQPEQLFVVVLGTASKIQAPIIKAGPFSATEVRVIPYDQE